MRLRTIAACHASAAADHADPFTKALADLRRIDAEQREAVATFIKASEEARAVFERAYR